MTMYWPEQDVALIITDDISSANVKECTYPSTRIVETTTEEISTPEGMDALAQRLADALGRSLPERTPEWVRKNRELHRALGMDRL